VRDPAAGYRVVGICTPAGPAADDRSIDVDGQAISVVGIDQAIADAVRRTGAHTVALAATDHLHPTEIRRLIWELDALGVDLVIAPGLVDIAEDRLHSRPVAGMAMFEVTKPQHQGANSAAKRAFDIAFTTVAMIAVAPLFALAALAVRLSGPGPIFYVSERIGLKGTTFKMLKFRSMVDGADAGAPAMIAADGTSPMFWKAKDDPRVTRVGKVLRKYSIDELPQFLNVLRGDMSVVGPRPQVRREVDSYDYLVRRRLTVKPGLTGLWQISGRSDLQTEDAVRLDLSYIENWSPIKDLVIIAKTIKTVLHGDGAY
jgi:exopolysaccharide biosynthesis polyprenyl glycosylphosphotransferase